MAGEGPAAVAYVHRTANQISLVKPSVSNLSAMVGIPRFARR